MQSTGSSSGDTDTNDALFQLADRVRRTKRLTVRSVLEAAHQEGVPVGWQDVVHLSRELRNLRDDGTPIPARVALDFLASYFQASDVETVLDPYAGNGVLITSLIDRGIGNRGVGIIPATRDVSIAELISNGRSIVWHNREPFDPDGRIDFTNEVDLIVSMPPLSGDKDTFVLESPTGSISVWDALEHRLVIAYCQLLSPQGAAVFVLSNRSVFSRNDDRSTLSKLKDIGVSINAIIALPKTTLAPLTNIPMNLVFMSRQKTADLFVAALTLEQSIDTIAMNLRKRKKGARRELGSLVDPLRFTTWHKFALQSEMDEHARRSRLTKARLGDHILDIKVLKRSEGRGFEPAANAVYLPLGGASPAVTDLEWAQLKPQSYAQIIMKPDGVSAEYVAGYFNSKLGRLVRDLWSPETFPHINWPSIRAMELYLPTPEIQLTVSKTARTIQELRIQLNEFERELWMHPGKAKSIANDVRRLNVEDSFKTWIESLPFPLASILHRYNSNAEVQAKIDYLLHFFEAAAEFFSTLMLSAFRSKPEFYASHRSRWLDSDHSRADWTQSSFGFWVTLWTRLAKLTRSMLSSGEREQCIALFNASDDVLPTAISSPNLRLALSTTKDYRNNWKGHAGAVGPAEQERQLEKLRVELTRFQEAIAFSFEGWRLLRPGLLRKRSGAYYQRADNLMGSNPLFEQLQEIVVTQPMEDDKLYLLDGISQSPLELLPFFRMMPGPRTEQNACYFYNRIDKKVVRWLSYHFDQESEVFENYPFLVEVISEFQSGAANHGD